MNKSVLIAGLTICAAIMGYVLMSAQFSRENVTQEVGVIVDMDDESSDVVETQLGSDRTGNFIEGALVSSSDVDCTLTDGSSSECVELVIAGAPADHEIGPFCPETTDTSADDAGIWMDGENLYDADGEFIINLAEIYDDPNWKLYNDDGTVRITDTQEAFEAAARPDVDPDYENYCVQGNMAWLDGGEPVQSTVTIPREPVLTETATQVSGKVGVTLGGVIIDPAAPVAAILGAYTIATFDDCGGHINPVEGYHLHGATGCSEVGEATDGETKAFALAMDGFSIHSPYADGEDPSDLDECNGHTTDDLGYHYHANPAQENAVLTCFMGELDESQASDGRGPGGAPGGQGLPR